MAVIVRHPDGSEHTSSGLSSLSDLMLARDDPEKEIIFVRGNPVIRDKQLRPVCIRRRCGKPARNYGPIGGYGRLCDQCADYKAAKQRMARRLRLNRKP